MAVLVLGCLEADLDVGTGVCSSPLWVPQSEGFASLSVADGAALGGAIVFLWCIGAAFRWARKSFLR